MSSGLCFLSTESLKLKDEGAQGCVFSQFLYPQQKKTQNRVIMARRVTGLPTNRSGHPDPYHIHSNTQLGSVKAAGPKSKPSLIILLDTIVHLTKKKKDTIVLFKIM